MKKRGVFVSLLILLLLISGGCKKTPTEPSPPKKKGVFSINFKNTPLNWIHNGWVDAWECNFTLIVGDTNGVGGTISIVETVVYVQNAEVASNTVGGGYVSANGSVEIDCFIAVDDQYQFDEMIVTANGIDNNGYSFSISTSQTYNWDSFKPMLFREY